MDTQERRTFYNPPLHEYRRRLEELVKETKCLKVQESYSSIIEGTARVKVSGKKKRIYEVKLDRDFPRYKVSLDYDEKDLPEASILETCILRAVQGEACVYVVINGKQYGAIPIGHHKL